MPPLVESLQESLMEEDLRVSCEHQRPKLWAWASGVGTFKGVQLGHMGVPACAPGCPLAHCTQQPEQRSKDKSQEPRVLYWPHHHRVTVCP